MLFNDKSSSGVVEGMIIVKQDVGDDLTNLYSFGPTCQSAKTFKAGSPGNLVNC